MRPTTAGLFRIAPTPVLTGSKKLISPRVMRVRSWGRRVASEEVVTVFCRRVAREALCVQRLVARFAVGEVGKSPAAGCGVLFRVLDHELNVRGRPGKGGVETCVGETGRQRIVVCV